MNGATAVPSVRKIKNPKRNKKIIIGASHHFFLSDKKSQNSLNIDSFDIMFSSFKIVFRSLDLARILYHVYSKKNHDYLILNLENLFQIILLRFQ